MAQLLVVLLYVIWVSAVGDRPLPHGPVDLSRLAIFLAGFAAIVAAPAVVARWLTRGAAPAFPHWSTHRGFSRLMSVCRFAIIAWFALGVLGTDAWRAAVGMALGPVNAWPVTLPGMLIGPLPAMLAAAGLWWAQYPIDHMARERNVLPMLESDLPVHAPPTLAAFMESSLRMQILVSAVPILLIALLRDAAGLGLWLGGVLDPRTGVAGAALAYGAAVVVLVLAPEPLRRVLHTARLPDSLLRRRLDALCALARTRYREVLLWHTHYTFGNAAVMGVFPRLRYVLLSDLLLESMDDREIEAVFAHELGHVVHRHTLWYLAFIVALGIVWSLLASAVAVALHESGLPAWADTTLDASAGVALLAGAVALFGAFSRRVERQADVYAARAMQLAAAPPPGGEPLRPDVLGSPVGPHGAEALASALHRAAVINNMPVSARSFRHGSIARRIAFIRSLAYDPSRTFRFDRAMRRLYTAVLLALAAGGSVAAWLWR